MRFGVWSKSFIGYTKLTWTNCWRSPYGLYITAALDKLQLGVSVSACTIWFAGTRWLFSSPQRQIWFASVTSMDHPQKCTPHIACAKHWSCRTIHELARSRLWTQDIDMKANVDIHNCMLHYIPESDSIVLVLLESCLHTNYSSDGIMTYTCHASCSSALCTAGTVDPSIANSFLSGVRIVKTNGQTKQHTDNCA